MRFSRRQFLAGAASWLAGPWLSAGCARGVSRIEGSIVGAGLKTGHRLREGGFPAPSQTRRADIVIVGGGIAGLSAGWKLERSGLKDFLVLDLEPEPGGNSRWGENQVSRYPWGAHYIPFPSPEAKAVSELFRELKIETGRDRAGHPIYDERFVCFAPTDRLFVHGRWQEGIFPRLGSQPEDLRQLQSFERRMSAWRKTRDAQGRRAFALPMEKSSPDWRGLDSISMAEYLDQNGWTSPRLRWYVEYGLRDDFGSLLAETSAWAGIHYFAARGQDDDAQVLTWPEGNGYIVRRLAETLSGRVQNQALAFRVERDRGGARVDYYDAAQGRSVRVLCRAALVCAPRFVARRIVAGLKDEEPAAFRYSPWVVANLTVEDPPPGHGVPPAWDNVLYRGSSLGYVIATHQSLRQLRRESVWTCYLPLTQGDEDAVRRAALETPWEAWRDRVLADLSPAHPELASHVRRIDVMIWGHGMVKPAVGFVWGKPRRQAAKPLGNIFFGHSDLSGFSLFEEAQYRGVLAAESAMASLGHSFRSSL